MSMVGSAVYEAPGESGSPGSSGTSTRISSAAIGSPRQPKRDPFDDRVRRQVAEHLFEDVMAADDAFHDKARVDLR
jgi:hypothetical protein